MIARARFTALTRLNSGLVGMTSVDGHWHPDQLLDNPQIGSFLILAESQGHPTRTCPPGTVNVYSQLADASLTIQRLS